MKYCFCGTLCAGPSLQPRCCCTGSFWSCIAALAWLLHLHFILCQASWIPQHPDLPSGRAGMAMIIGAAWTPALKLSSSISFFLHLSWSMLQSWPCLLRLTGIHSSCWAVKKCCNHWFKPAWVQRVMASITLKSFNLLFSLFLFVFPLISHLQ